MNPDQHPQSSTPPAPPPSAPRCGAARHAPAILVLISAATVFFAGPVIVQRLGQVRTTTRVEIARQHLSQTDVLRQFNDAVRNLAAAVEPSVVHITAQRADYEATSGSGWVYDDAGHIVTNHHVIDGATAVEIKLHDGTTHAAALVGSDPRTDIAVLRLSSPYTLVGSLRATGRPVVQGDLVFAFGSPFGFEFSMSSGIVSGQGRQTGLDRETYENYIQTDAAINRGNSGGPLTNVLGEVVGMNTATAVDPARAGPRGQFINSGVGLAIPLDMIEFVADQLIADGRVHTGGMGVSIDILTPRTRADLGFDSSGVVVTVVTPGSAAATAGLQPLDIITTVNGAAVSTPAALKAIVHNQLPGAVVQLRVWRAGETLDLPLILGEWDRDLDMLPSR